VPEGQVDVQWKAFTRGNQPWLELDWTERGGPEVKPPQRRGFGSRLISEGITYELGGEVSLDFPLTGVSCRILIPISDPEVGDG
jgi:two-component system CheB/CheR fusion protein